MGESLNLCIHYMNQTPVTDPCATVSIVLDQELLHVVVNSDFLLCRHVLQGSIEQFIDVEIVRIRCGDGDAHGSGVNGEEHVIRS